VLDYSRSREIPSRVASAFSRSRLPDLPAPLGKGQARRRRARVRLSLRQYAATERWRAVGQMSMYGPRSQTPLSGCERLLIDRGEAVEHGWPGVLLRVVASTLAQRLARRV